MYKYMIRKDGGIQVFGAKDNKAAKEKAGEHPLFILIGLNWVPVVNGKIKVPKGTEFVGVSNELFKRINIGDVLYCHQDLHRPNNQLIFRKGTYYEVQKNYLLSALTIVNDDGLPLTVRIEQVKKHFSLPYSSASLNGANATEDGAEAKS